MAFSPVPIEEMISEQNVFSKCWFCWFTLSEKLPSHRKSPKSFLCNRLMFRLTQKILPLNFSWTAKLQFSTQTGNQVISLQSLKIWNSRLLMEGGGCRKLGKNTIYHLLDKKSENMLRFCSTRKRVNEMVNKVLPSQTPTSFP